MKDRVNWLTRRSARLRTTKDSSYKTFKKVSEILAYVQSPDGTKFGKYCKNFLLDFEIFPS